MASVPPVIGILASSSISPCVYRLARLLTESFSLGIILLAFYILVRFTQHLLLCLSISRNTRLSYYFIPSYCSLKLSLSLSLHRIEIILLYDLASSSFNLISPHGIKIHLMSTAASQSGCLCDPGYLTRHIINLVSLSISLQRSSWQFSRQFITFLCYFLLVFLCSFTSSHLFSPFIHVLAFLQLRLRPLFPLPLLLQVHTHFSLSSPVTFVTPLWPTSLPTHHPVLLFILASLLTFIFYFYPLHLLQKSPMLFVYFYFLFSFLLLLSLPPDTSFVVCSLFRKPWWRILHHRGRKPSHSLSFSLTATYPARRWEIMYSGALTHEWRDHNALSTCGTSPAS